MTVFLIDRAYNYTEVTHTSPKLKSDLIVDAINRSEWHQVARDSSTGSSLVPVPSGKGAYLDG